MSYAISSNVPFPRAFAKKVPPVAVTVSAAGAAFLIAALVVPHFREAAPVAAVPSITAEPVAIPRDEIAPEPAPIQPVAPRVRHVKHIHHERKTGCECACRHMSPHVSHVAMRGDVAAFEDAGEVAPRTLTLADAFVHLLRSFNHGG